MARWRPVLVNISQVNMIFHICDEPAQTCMSAEPTLVRGGVQPQGGNSGYILTREGGRHGSSLLSNV